MTISMNIIVSAKKKPDIRVPLAIGNIKIKLKKSNKNHSNNNKRKNTKCRESPVNTYNLFVIKPQIN